MVYKHSPEDFTFGHTWQQRFLKLAFEVSKWSKDPSTQVGAVIVRPDKTVASMGFNGFPRGIADTPEVLADRPEKYKRVIHAEMNAILHAREPLHGYVLFVSVPPCSHCVSAIIQSGISEVVWLEPPTEFADRWKDSTITSIQLLKEARVLYDVHSSLV